MLAPSLGSRDGIWWGKNLNKPIRYAAAYLVHGAGFGLIPGGRSLQAVGEEQPEASGHATSR